MKKPNLILIGITLMLILMTSVAYTANGSQPAKQMYYELRIYRLTDPGKNAVIDKYLKESFIPAVHRAGIPTVGVFKPIEKDTAYGKMVYVFIPYENMDEYLKVVEVLENDPLHKQTGKEFLDAPYNDPPFTSYESILMKAFAFMPRYRVPSFTTPRKDRIYELRSYASWTEEKATKKIHMFNEGGEMAIFEKIGSNAVFYAQVLLGSQKPRLIYMTTYSDIKSQAEHWDAFRNHPDWKTLSAMEEYANTVIRPLAYLLYPTDYSDF